MEFGQVEAQQAQEVGLGVPALLVRGELGVALVGEGSVRELDVRDDAHAHVAQLEVDGKELVLHHLGSRIPRRVGKRVHLCEKGVLDNVDALWDRRVPVKVVDGRHTHRAVVEQ